MTDVQTIYPADRVILREVGLRDGLQLVKRFPSTAAKRRWIRDEYGAGVRHFEVGSFLPAKTFPQFADVREVIGTVAALPSAHGVALVLNERGVNEALASGVAEEIKRWDVNELSAKLDRLNICFSPINRPEDLLTDPHVLRPGGLVNNTNANGKPFRVPALPIEWNGGHLGEGLQVPVLGADTEAVRAELEREEKTPIGKVAGRIA